MVGLICYLVAAVGCNGKDTGSTGLPLQTNYYFEMDAAKQAKFRTILQKMKIGDDYHTIVVALGKPDYNRALVTKDGKFIARSLMYYLKKWNKDLVTEGKDQYVELQLDTNNHLMRILSNVEGIPNRPAEAR